MAAHRAEALRRAQLDRSHANYRTIIDGFVARGIAIADIMPRHNVFTYEAWLALDRQVRRGEHGVKIPTIVETTKTDDNTGEEQTRRRSRSTTVFHVSQTEEIVQ